MPSDVTMMVAIPVIVSGLTAIVGMFIKWIFHVFEKKSKDIDTQLERAQKVHDSIIGDMDDLFSRMRNQAVFIAFLNANEPDKVTKEDHEKWKTYTEKLLNWRKNIISHGAEVEMYFCKTGDWTELKNCKELFDEADRHFETLSQRLWKLYHAHSEEKYIHLEEGTFCPDFKDVKEEKAKGFHFSEFNTIEHNMKTLSTQMTTRIQQNNVGDLNAKDCCWAWIG